MNDNLLTCKDDMPPHAFKKSPSLRSLSLGTVGE